MTTTHSPLRRPRRIALWAAACAAATTVGTVPSADAAAPGRSDLVGPQADVSCEELEPGAEDVSQPGPGFVVFKTRAGVLSARLVLRDAQPRTDYVVRVLQTGDDATTCFIVNGVLRTDGRGNGALRVSEPITGFAAQIIVNTGSLFGLPTYRAAEAFSLAS